MTLEDQLKSFRDKYIGSFMDARAKFEKEDKKIGAEIQAVPNNVQEHWSFGGCFRIDMIFIDTLQPIAIQCNPIEPIRSRYIATSTLILEVLPCAWWNISFECANFDQGDQAFIDWYEKWYDVNDKGFPVEAGLMGLIHAVTKVERQGDSCVFSVDFGTASVDSALELISVFSSQGVRNLKIATIED